MELFNRLQISYEYLMLQKYLQVFYLYKYKESFISRNPIVIVSDAVLSFPNHAFSGSYG